jgi:hypothetical protein
MIHFSGHPGRNFPQGVRPLFGWVYLTNFVARQQICAIKEEILSALPSKGTPVVVVSIDQLSREPSLRSRDLSEQHVIMLTGLVGQLPPIVVHHPSMQIIDGAHRTEAVLRRGGTDIQAVFFRGTDEEAFLLGLKLNLKHGLPLTAEDRRQAVDRLTSLHPEWSDRRIAMLTGVSPKTVGAHRPRLPKGGDQQPVERVGRDGRTRSVKFGAGRRRASELARSRPEASARETTANSAAQPRRRSAREQVPVPVTSRADPSPHETPDESASGARDAPKEVPGDPEPSGRHPLPPAPEAAEYSQMLRSLAADPAVRSTIVGRLLLNALHVQGQTMVDLDQMIQAIPAHRRSSIAGLARRCADQWLRLASALDKTRDV